MPEYWKGCLSQSDKVLYDDICDGIRRGKREVSVRGILNPQSTQQVFMYVLYDHPEFYNASPQLGMIPNPFAPKLLIQYLYNSSDVNKMENTLSNLLNKYKSLIGQPQIDIEKAILTELVLNTKYDINNLYNQNAMSAIYNHTAQCSGFSMAFQLLMNRLGVWCISVMGEAGDPTGNRGPHAWNIINLDGKYYHVDPTMMWGANTTQTLPLRFHRVNCSDNTMIQAGYKWDTKLTPPCNNDMNLCEQTSPQNPSYQQVNSNLPTFTRLFDLNTFVYNTLKSGNYTFSFVLNIPQYEPQKLVNIITMVVKEKLGELQIYTSFEVRGQGNQFTVACKK